MKLFPSAKWILGLVLAVASLTSFAQTLPREIWNEKWPVTVDLIPENSVGTYLRANFGKVGEIAADKIKNWLNDPAAQAKLSQSALKYLKGIYNDQTQTEDQKAKAFIAAIEADIGPYVSAPSGPFNLTAGFSGSFSVFRLTWARQMQRLSCQKQTCTCPNGAYAPFLGYTCYYYDAWGFYRSTPATCQLTTDTVDTEAKYVVYRNEKVLTTFAEQRKVNNGYTQPFSFLGANLSVTLPPGKFDTTGTAGPWYDYDGYMLSIGTPLSYKVVASSTGCGPTYNNSYTGWNPGTVSAITVDANGDSVPDFYPPDVLAAKRASTVTMPGTPPEATAGTVKFAVSLVSSNDYHPPNVTWSVKNVGSVATTITGIGLVSSMSGGWPYVSSSNCTIGSLLAPGASCTVVTSGGDVCTGGTYYLTATNPAGTSQATAPATVPYASCGA